MGRGTGRREIRKDRISPAHPVFVSLCFPSIILLLDKVVVKGKCAMYNVIINDV